MAALDVLNLKKVWRGEVPVRQVFFVWGILGNLVWQVVTFISNIVWISLLFPRKQTKLYPPGEVPPEAVGMVYKSRPASFWKFDSGDILGVHLLLVIIFFVVTLIFISRCQDSLARFYTPIHFLVGLITIPIWLYLYAAMSFLSGF